MPIDWSTLLWVIGAQFAVLVAAFVIWSIWESRPGFRRFDWHDGEGWR